MYKFTGSASLSAALGDGDNALTQLQRALTILPKGPTVTPNTLYSEGGWPTFESPISASRSVLDMLSLPSTARIGPVSAFQNSRCVAVRDSAKRWRALQLRIR